MTPTDTPLMVEQDLCDICCRPKSQHVARDLQCPETAYFRPMSSLHPDPATKLADITQDVAPDLARAVERLERFCASQHEPPGYKETGPGIYFADVRAVLAALPKVDEGDVERVAAALRAYFVEHTGFATVDHDGCVSAYYGRSWIALSPTAIARAALTSLPNQGEAEILREALVLVADAQLRNKDGAVMDVGWSISKLNAAHPSIRKALAASLRARSTAE